MEKFHQPVLLKEVLKYLAPQPNENFIDATFGFGGHSLAILKLTQPEGQVLGIEADNQVLVEFKKQIKDKDLKKRLILVQGNFAQLKEIVQNYHFQPIKGILFDLGFSSWQIEKSGRGFSFRRDEPLDMSYVQGSSLRAEEIINQWKKEEIERILREYGEERYARRIAQAVCQARKTKPIKTTLQLVEVIARAVPVGYRKSRIHFATRTFQALRIAVNDELNNLQKALPQAIEILEEGGRLVVISFHSLEDRIVKKFFQNQAQQERLKILTKKPVRPTQTEVLQNPRSRSARLRAGQKA